MSTRALIHLTRHIYGDDPDTGLTVLEVVQPYATIYHHQAGYPAYLGARLAEILAANDTELSLQAISVILELAGEEAGMSNVYLEPVGAADMGEEWVYEVVHDNYLAAARVRDVAVSVLRVTGYGGTRRVYRVLDSATPAELAAWSLSRYEAAPVPTTVPAW